MTIRKTAETTTSTTTTDADRGQVGIGTLIIFIAMVLVAAIAAGVLIDTAGLLQSQASTTGSESQDAVTNQIEIVHASGDVNRTDDFLDTYDEPYIGALNLTIKKSAGSDAIDLSSMTIEYTSDRVAQTLVYNESQSIANYEDPAHADGSAEFITTGITGTDDESLTATDERVELGIHVRALEERNGNPGLAAGDRATVTLVDQSGAQFTYAVSAPSTFGDKDVVLV